MYKIEQKITFETKQEATLLHQNPELRATGLIYPVLHHVTSQCPANFLHFLQSENTGSPDGDPMILAQCTHDIPQFTEHPSNALMIFPERTEHPQCTHKSCTEHPQCTHKSCTEYPQ